MTASCIAVMAPGDMGHAVGKVLGEHGHDVITCLAGRSGRTRGLAEKGGLRDVPDLETLVREADLILSILPPVQAVRQAEDMAAAMTAAGTTAVYVDCNAISPGTMARVAAAFKGAGAPVVDAGIIGLAPAPGRAPRFYVSGPDTTPMEALNGQGITVIALGGEIGRASGLKMAYAALTKGTWTLHTAILMAAERMGLFDELIAEFENSQQAALKGMRERTPRLPADSGRWVREMEEIAQTFRDAGVPGNFHDGAAEVFRILSRTPFADETRETIDPNRTMEQSVAEFVRHLDAGKDAADD
jgi:3-hydroxyisobutyrate dehydrogenase-like beta-hydroxyacid dehydrogenase